MGSNDHTPVPDPISDLSRLPTPDPNSAQLKITGIAEKDEDLTAEPQKLTIEDQIQGLWVMIDSIALIDRRHSGEIAELQKLADQVNNMEGYVHGTILALIDGVRSKEEEMKSKLKQVARAVERLAKGKSLGALGLPSEEEWNPPA